MSTLRRHRSRSPSGVALALRATLASLVFPAAAFAQTTGGGGGGGGGGAAPVAPPAAPPTNAYSAAAAVGMGNPQSTNGTIGGGNATESSAHPVTGDQEDSFDYGARGAGGGAAHGDANGPIFMQPANGPAMTLGGGQVPSTYLVRKGDTLWAIGDRFYQNPYLWPRLWSYNPQIRNPHWINPGDELRLKEGGDGLAGPGTGAGGTDGAAGKPMPTDGATQSIVDRRRQVPTDTVFLRDQGWVHDKTDQVWGDISGAPRDKMFLSDLDEVYVAMRPGHDVKLGQELTIFRPQKTSASGDIVQILGTARVDQYDPHERIARARIVETLDVIERGSDVGPLERRFQVVPPKRNEVEAQAHVLASVHPHEFYGQHSVVFIDKGEAAGLKPGNRLFVVRRGDAWRHSLVTAGAGYRVSPDDERPMPPMEKTPGPKRDEQLYPDEIVGELRVLSVRKDSAVCLVTQSNQEIEIHDVAVARKGY